MRGAWSLCQPRAPRPAAVPEPAPAARLRVPGASACRPCRAGGHRSREDPPAPSSKSLAPESKVLLSRERHRPHVTAPGWTDLRGTHPGGPLAVPLGPAGHPADPWGPQPSALAAATSLLDSPPARRGAPSRPPATQEWYVDSGAHAAHPLIHSIIHLCTQQTWLSVAGGRRAAGGCQKQSWGPAAHPQGLAASEDRERRGPAPPRKGVPEGCGELGQRACSGHLPWSMPPRHPAESGTHRGPARGVPPPGPHPSASSPPALRLCPRTRSRRPLRPSCPGRPGPAVPVGSARRRPGTGDSSAPIR